MSRGIREQTRKSVELKREQKPLAIGPMLGDIAMQFDVSASMVAEILDVHEQTILRWYMGQSDVPAYACIKIGPLLAFLLWMHQEKFEPLEGSAKRKRREFAQRYKQYQTLD